MPTTELLLLSQVLIRTNREHRVKIMVRYRGRPSAKTIARTYPYKVELQVPEGGFGKQSNVIAAWYIQRGLVSQSGTGCCRESVWFVRECFAHYEDAEEFRAAFGGTMNHGVSRRT